MQEIPGQLSMFDEPDRIEKMDRLHKMLREALDQLHNPGKSNPQDCRRDIKRMIADTGAKPDELAKKLIDYFGTGGFSLKGGMFNMDPDSCWIQAWRPWETMIISWKAMAKEIIRLNNAGFW